MYNSQTFSSSSSPSLLLKIRRHGPIIHIIDQPFHYRVCVTFKGYSTLPLDRGRSIRRCRPNPWWIRYLERGHTTIQTWHVNVSPKLSGRENSWYRVVEERILPLEGLEVFFIEEACVDHLLLGGLGGRVSSLRRNREHFNRKEVVAALAHGCGSSVLVGWEIMAWCCCESAEISSVVITHAAKKIRHLIQ